MTLIAAILCLIYLKELVGVREGTIIAALIVGNIVKLIKKRVEYVTRLIVSGKQAINGNVTREFP